MFGTKYVYDVVKIGARELKEVSKKRKVGNTFPTFGFYIFASSFTRYCSAQ